MKLRETESDQWSSYFVTDKNRELLDKPLDFDIQITDLQIYDLPQPVTPFFSIVTQGDFLGLTLTHCNDREHTDFPRNRHNSVGEARISRVEDLAEEYIDK